MEQQFASSGTHFVIATAGTSGDIYPFIEIGRYLLSRNCKVSFMTSPYFQTEIEANGLRFVPFGTAEQMLGALGDSNMWDPKHGFKHFWARAIRPNIHGIRSFVRSLAGDEKVVILANAVTMALADLARAEHRNLKIILFYLSPMFIRTRFGKVGLGDVFTIPKRLPKVLRRMLWSLIDTKFLDVGVVPDLNAARTELGLARIEHFFPHLQSAADLYVSLFPDWYAPAKPDYPQPLISGHFLLHTPSQNGLSDELREFLEAGQAPILFTPGTGNMHARKFFEVAFDVVEQLGARAVFLTKFKDQLPASLPGSILWQRHVPFNELLPRASIMVHHGGIGTLAEASKAGIPQVIVPFAYDQFDNALIIKDLGLGRSIPLRFLTQRKLFNALSQIQRSVDIWANCKTVSLNFGADMQIMDRVVAAL